MIDKKLSVIVPVYNAEKHLKNCLDCLINQTYRNIEIIIVNDGSLGNCKEIYEEYKEKDKRIKYVEHDKNKGLFQARITGVINSTGDYIAFLDSDDHVTIDYYRALIYKAEETKSDIVFANIILEINYENNRQIQYNLFDTKFKDLEGDEVLENYFDQKGLNFSWHTTPNKIYSKRIWNLALNDYKEQNKHLVMTEDVAFSTVLFYYAKRVTKVDTEAMFYCKHDDASTSTNNISYKKIKKNIEDLTTSFNFVEKFLKKKKVYDKYKKNFIYWKSLYCGQHKKIADTFNAKDNEKEEIEKLFSMLNKDDKAVEDDGFFSSIASKWNNKLDDLKRKISSTYIKCISFDIFDTLVVRPFFVPKDLFKLLNKKFTELENNNIDFSVMRENAEVIARQNHKYKNGDITLDDIYLEMKNLYGLSDKIINEMKNLEVEYELRFCQVRETSYQLYQLAKYLGKKVICTSDMYLPKNIISKILERNNYNEVDDIYVSCEVNKTKSSGELFEYVCSKLNLQPSEILHIGDNYNSDYEIPKKIGLNAAFFPRTIALASDKKYSSNLFQLILKDLPLWEDNKAAFDFLGIRCMLAVVANKYFDNPFRFFNKDSDFNGDPFLIGYYNLGMYLFGIVKWIIDDINTKKYDSIVFMARDGYLPMEAYKLFKKLYTKLPEEKYLYISRKALIPAMLQSKKDYYKLNEIINIYNASPLKIINYIKDMINYDESKFQSVCQKENIDINKPFDNISEYNNFIKIIIDNFYNEEKQKSNLIKLKKYFNDFYTGNSSTFDVGYSGRPEYYISLLCNKSIDTYFVNINSDEALKYSRKGKYRLKTFFDFKPHITGNFYELCLSSFNASCIKYNLDGDKVIPVFEEFKCKYEEKFIIDKMQSAALLFVSDMIDIFGNDIDELYYQNYYITLPIQAYVHSSREYDRSIFNAFKFEDDVKSTIKLNVNTLWSESLKTHNQRFLCDMITQDTEYDDSEVYYVDLKYRNRVVKIIYYLFIDRVKLKAKIKCKLKNHKLLTKIFTKMYRIARKIKNHGKK